LEKFQIKSHLQTLNLKLNTKMTEYIKTFSIVYKCMKVNPVMKSTLTFLLIVAACSFNLLNGQEIYDYEKRETYTIANVNIIGGANRDKNAIKSMTGLREGEEIEIPGSSITKAMKALLRLRLFDDVQIYVDSIKEENLYLTLVLVDKPTLSRYFFTGVKNSAHEDLNEVVKKIMTKESIVTDDQKELAKVKLEEHYINKGKLDTEVTIIESIDTARQNNSIILEFAIDQKTKVKIQEITFENNTNFSDKKLRKKLKSTKQKGTLFKKSKYVEKDYEEDKDKLIAFYNEKGYKNARIIKDSIWRNAEGNLMINFVMDEGNIFKYKDITWKGNTVYSEDQLNRILGILPGDIYNPKLLEQRLRFSQDGRDVSSLYLDDGYLSFNVDPVETAIFNDSIVIQMSIYEGPQFTIGDVEIKGNDRTHDHVIRRTVRTLPGEKFSRSKIIRSQREIINLGYFNQENMDIATPVNEAAGTVDVIYSLEEKSSDQLELSAGYGGFSGLIGTLGVTFNNFSLTNIKDRKTWSPLPQGDGQKFSVRVQSNSRFFRSMNASFTEPWLGGKKPQSLTVGAFQTVQDFTINNQGKFGIFRAFAGLGRQLKWPDDYFSSSTQLIFEKITLADYNVFQQGFSVLENGVLTPIRNGGFNNISINQTISRSSVNDPLYPRSGSTITLSMQFTPPYSLIKKRADYQLTEQEKGEIITRLNEEFGPADPPTSADIESEFNSIRLANNYKFLEYHKWKFNADFYFNLIGKLVMKAQAKMGFLGYYNRDLPVSPFERFQLGGSGLNNQNFALQGREIISMRGYNENTDFPINNRGAATIYDKFTLELRYPVSLNPTSTIYFTTFAQGGNAWSRFKDFNPFQMKRAAGVGLRVFLPMFGLLGFDYGIGFDKDLPPNYKLKDLGQFNIVIGFEPE
jgi:outer membrane protein insertion porin family